MGGFGVVKGGYRQLGIVGWFQVVTGAYEWLLVVMGGYDNLRWNTKIKKGGGGSIIKVFRSTELTDSLL